MMFECNMAMENMEHVPIFMVPTVVPVVLWKFLFGYPGGVSEAIVEDMRALQVGCILNDMMVDATHGTGIYMPTWMA